ncbi:hypothetical protein [Rhodococcus sp. 1139]|uniref:hypothetical protein n=1 Tax=Rhodococcus sp. 1139 TaxID=1833762 RepID=UPI0008721879|nr:hypothetical protein [Rhodococcus sp. 1139]OFE05483.1 hypothetical protein A5N83_27060 [Rhodococcus sp. 1139]
MTDLSKPPPNHPDNRPDSVVDGKVEVPVRDNSNVWPPTPDETATVPVSAADHWDDRIWRRNAL